LSPEVGQEFLPDALRSPLGVRHVHREPSRHLLLVSDGGDPEAKVSADLSTVELNRAAGSLVGPDLRTVHTDLACHEVDHAIVQI
jgi:hypothetical protein